MKLDFYTKELQICEDINMSNYVAFDIGNVLCRINFQEFTECLSDVLNITPWEAGHRFNHTQKLRDLGTLNMRDVLEMEFGIKSSVTINKISDAWNNCVKFDLEVINYFNEFDKKHGLHVALVSNIGSDHSELIKPFFKWNSTFEESTKFFSCDAGVRKPTYIYYQTFLQMHPEFKGCVYVDDLDENLAVGEMFGLKSFKFDLTKFTDYKPLMDELDKIAELILTTSASTIKNCRWH
jgi:FMN phosphatase YigB (HAD superfamily)